MRLLHVSDFHYNRGWFDWLTQAAPAFDAVALTGDLVGPVREAAIEEQIQWLTQWAKAFPAPLLLCSGNHDHRRDDVPASLRHWLTRLASPGVLADGQHRTLQGWNFESVAWNEMPRRGGPWQIALSHCPPCGAATAIGHPECVDWGDFELAQRLRHGRREDVPRIVLSGHVHRPRHWHASLGATLSLNPGVAAGARWPSHIVLDFAARTAVRFSPDCASEWTIF